MAKPKAKKRLPDLDRMIENHRPGCAIRRFSDGADRHCSCGLEGARAEVARLRAIEAKYIESLQPLELPLFERIVVDA